MATPFISTRDYSTVISATQDINRCIRFLANETISSSIFSATIAIDPNNNVENQSILFNEIKYVFTSSTPTNDFEVQVGATNTDTATNLANALYGSSTFPVYNYNVNSVGASVNISSKRIGARYTVSIISTTPNAVITSISNGSDISLPPNYRLFIQLDVNGTFKSSLSLIPESRFEMLSDAYILDLYLDTNNLLKDTVYSPDPQGGAGFFERVNGVSGTVTLKAHNVYDGYNGLEVGDVLTESEGIILNSRGTRFNGQNSMEQYHPSIYPTELQKFFIEHPDFSIDYCRESPKKLYLYVNDSLLNNADINFRIIGTTISTSSPVDLVFEQPIDNTIYTSGEEGVYGINLETLVTFFTGTNIDSITIHIETPLTNVQISDQVTINFLDADDSQECCCENTFVFLNKFGVYETMNTECDVKQDMDIIQRLGTPCVDCNSDNVLGDTKVMNVSHNIKKTIYKTIPNNDEYIQWLKSFMYSSKVFKYEPSTDTYHPVKINTKTRTVKRTKQTLRVRIQYEEYPGSVSAKL